MKGSVFIAVAALICWFFQPVAAAPSFVYESPGEFLTSGDFNGDGVLDVLVVDKLTGNARVGYGDVSGNLYWSAPLATGAPNPSGCAVGYLLQTSREAVAVTSSTLNFVNLVDLSNSNNAAAPVVVTPNGIGPHTTVALANPLGGTPPAYNDLLTASSDNSDSAELLDLMGINAGMAIETGQYHESWPFDRGNALQVAGTASTFATGLVRGTNTDTLDIWQFTNQPAVMLSVTNLPAGGDYTFGIFNDGALYFIFNQPGGTNLTMTTLSESGGVFSFGNLVQTNVAEPIEGVFYLSLSSGGSAMIEFTNGVEGMSLSNNVIAFTSLYSAGAETGNVFSGVVPLGTGRFALLDAPLDNLTSAHAQVVGFNGHAFTQLSSGSLPAITTRNTRASVWLFESEPFVNRQAGFVASLSVPDWTDTSSGLPATLSVTAETDAGPANGLGSPAANNPGAPPTGSTNILVNQYSTAISVFSYGGPQSPQPVTVTISPPPGQYDSLVTISFTTLNGSDQVHYRVGPADSYHLYNSSFTITNDNIIQFYGTNPSQALRSQLQVAAYTVGNNSQISTLSNSPSVTGAPDDGITPPVAGVGPTNFMVSSTVGTVFYGRRSINNTGTIWAINLDGSADTYITTGVRPRASRDGQWLAFLREGNPFNSQGNLWIRNLQTGVEGRLLVNGSTIFGYDWKADDSGLILDYGCGIWELGLNGTLSETLATNCASQAPVLSPVNERIAYQDLGTPPNSVPGLWVAYPDGSSAFPIVTSVAGASWPEWSPDGQVLSFTDDNTLASVDKGTNLWVVAPDGSSLNRICDFTGTDNHFPHGAIWTPDSTSLVGAGMIDETNGLWIIPLNADRTDCGGLPILLPTSPGDAIDFAGSVVVANDAPVIVVQPQSIILQRGQSGGTSVTAIGGPPLHYEWIKDGFLLPNQTNSTISFACFQLTNSGIYQVVVTNPWGIAISYPVRIAISDAPLVGWGDDFYGELATGSQGGNFNLGPLITATNVVTASSTYNATLYVTADGNLWGVGQSGRGELGSYNIYYNPVFVASNVVEVACGEYSSLYLTADGTLWGMGNNFFGQLGIQANDYDLQGFITNDGTLGQPYDIYTPIPVASNVVAVSAAPYDAAFVTADGSLWTMGQNLYGELGDGTFNPDYYNCTDIPVNVAGNVVSVNANNRDTLFVTADGTLWGMGGNGNGELGDGTTNMVMWPEFLATNVVGASAGFEESVFLTADGTLWGMGNSAYLGIGVPADQYGQPEQMTSIVHPLALTNHVMVASTESAGYFYATTDGTLWAAGSIAQLSEYNEDYLSTPVPYNGSSGSTVGSLMHSQGLTIFTVAWLNCQEGVYTNLTRAPGNPFNLTSYGVQNECLSLASSYPNNQADPVEIAYTSSLQWQLNGVNIPGATNENYGVANATVGDAGVYTLVSVSPFNMVESVNSATVSILTPPSAPTITQQPANVSAAPGQPARVSVSATGSGVPLADPLSYEWIKDGVLLPGQTSNTLNFTSFQLTNSGVYQVIISNALGLTISEPALVGYANAPLRGWGFDNSSQLGDGQFSYAQVTPELVASNVVTEAVGGQYSLYVTADGTLWGMGYDYDGELGDYGNNSGIQYFPEALATNVVAVAAGEYHSLYLTADGTLWSMGQNSQGQLGQYSSSYTPGPVATNVVAIAAGGYHSLYLTADGTLWGMGNNADGELGDGTFNNADYPEPLATNVVSLAAGETCSFFITADGILRAMGDDSQGELGDGGTEINTNLYEAIATNVVAVATGGYPSPILSVGGYHTLFVTADGNLWAMGYNGDGELADGGSELSVNVPEMVDGGVVAVSAGGAQSYFVTGDGTLWAAGDDSYGEFGLGYDQGGVNATPTMVSGGGTVTATLAKGEAAFHALSVFGEAPEAYLPAALATNGQSFTFIPIIERGDGPITYQWYYSWGYGLNEIRDATNATYTVLDALPDYVGKDNYFVLVTGAYGSQYIYNAYYFPAPLAFYTWYSSAGASGQVGAGQSAFLEGEYYYNPSPVTYQWLKDGAVLPGQNSFYLSIGSFAFTNTGAYQVVADTSAGITISPPVRLALSNATLQVWGADNAGQLGDGKTNNVVQPETVASNVVITAAGANHALLVTAGGALLTMGQNTAGQLGDGSTNNVNVPEQIATNVLAAAAGGDYSLFVTADGNLWGMGADGAGQLGDGDDVPEWLPEPVTTNAVTVAAGQEHSLFLDSSGNLWAMGQNTYGQLGDGSTNNASLPEMVATNVIAVAAGGQHSLYLTADLNLWAMGLNRDGQLGIGTNFNALLPAWVASNVLAMAAGDAHSLYVSADGNLWAMGRNNFGQLGIGTTTGTNVPVEVTAASNVTTVSAGANHSLYLTSDGRVWAMGQNTSGQLGDGGLNNSPIPLPVASGGLIAASVARGSEASAALAVAEAGPSLAPMITALTVQSNPSGSGRVITLTVNPSQTYTVLVSTDLKTWTSLGTFMPNSLGQIVITDTGATTSTRFYKLQQM